MTVIMPKWGVIMDHMLLNPSGNHQVLEHWVFFALVPVICLGVWFLRGMMRRILTNVPALGEPFRLYDYLQLSTYLEVALADGRTITDALDAGRAVTTGAIRRRLAHFSHTVANGQDWREAFLAAGLCPKNCRWLVHARAHCSAADTFAGLAGVLGARYERRRRFLARFIPFGICALQALLLGSFVLAMFLDWSRLAGGVW
jgi:type II secretory pathway component PulF